MPELESKYLWRRVAKNIYRLKAGADFATVIKMQRGWSISSNKFQGEVDTKPLEKIEAMMNLDGVLTWSRGKFKCHGYVVSANDKSWEIRYKDVVVEKGEGDKFDAVQEMYLHLACLDAFRKAVLGL